MARLDVFLVKKGFFQSRAKAQSAISQGFVYINGKKSEKPSINVEGDEEITVTEEEKFVSRAGEKLFHALNEFNVSVKGLTVLDIGASTGGFTDCLLQNGAEFVFALDVGKAQLAEKLRKDSRVAVMEGFNARNAVKGDFHREIQMIVMDVSFISQTLIYPACGDILAEDALMITLVKPQFEAGKSNIGKGGIVKDGNGKIIKGILEKIDINAEMNGFERIGFTQSPILGGDGNKEYLAIFRKKQNR